MHGATRLSGRLTGGLFRIRSGDTARCRRTTEGARALPGRTLAGGRFRIWTAERKRVAAHEGLRDVLGMHDPRAVPVHREGHPASSSTTWARASTSSTGTRAAPRARWSRPTTRRLPHRRRAQPRPRRAGRARPGHALQRLLLDLQGDAAATSRPHWRERDDDQRAARDRGPALDGRACRSCTSPSGWPTYMGARARRQRAP